jgi:hypothetical protein
VCEWGEGARVIKRLFLAQEQKIRWQKHISFFIGHEALFYESASALEEVVETVDNLIWLPNSAKKCHRFLLLLIFFLILFFTVF